MGRGADARMARTRVANMMMRRRRVVGYGEKCSSSLLVPDVLGHGARACTVTRDRSRLTAGATWLRLSRLGHPLHHPTCARHPPKAAIMASWAEAGSIYTHSGGMLGVPTCALTFDPSRELLWTGTAQGSIESYYGPALQRYTGWLANKPSTRAGGQQDFHGGHAGVRGILCDERAVYSVGDGGIKAAVRRGTGRWNVFMR